jgi:hypothetical protein
MELSVGHTFNRTFSGYASFSFQDAETLDAARPDQYHQRGGVPAKNI